jgi:hypothetical protein
MERELVGAIDGQGVGGLRAVLARRASLIDPLRLVAAAWWAALVAIAVLQQAHADLHEHLELPVVLHLLRDGALAVPAAGLALVAATVAVGPDLGSRGAGSLVRALVWAAAAAAAFALLSIPGNQLHGALFGAEEEAELSWIADVALDAGLAFAGSLLALAPLALVAGPPVRRGDLDAGPIPISRGPAGPRPTADRMTGSTM